MQVGQRSVLVPVAGGLSRVTWEHRVPFADGSSTLGAQAVVGGLVLALLGELARLDGRWQTPKVGVSDDSLRISADLPSGCAIDFANGIWRLPSLVQEAMISGGSIATPFPSPKHADRHRALVHHALQPPADGDSQSTSTSDDRRESIQALITDGILWRRACCAVVGAIPDVSTVAQEFPDYGVQVTSDAGFPIGHDTVGHHARAQRVTPLVRCSGGCRRYASRGVVAGYWLAPAPLPISPSFLPLQVAVAVLGGGHGSRLIAKLRGSGISYRATATLGVSPIRPLTEVAAITAHHSPERLLKVVSHVLSSTITRPLSSSEIERGKGYLTANAREIGESRSLLACHLADLLVAGANWAWWEGYRSALEMLLPEQINASADLWLRESKFRHSIVVCPTLGHGPEA